MSAQFDRQVSLASVGGTKNGPTMPSPRADMAVNLAFRRGSASGFAVNGSYSPVGATAPDAVLTQRRLNGFGYTTFPKAANRSVY
jgi:hypothetical protein